MSRVSENWMAEASSFFLRIYPEEGFRFSQTFEGLSEALCSFLGMQVELDGSFVWIGEREDYKWQVDGMIYDRANAVEYVELKGFFSRNELLSICSAVCQAQDSDRDSALKKSLEKLIRIHHVDMGVWTTIADWNRSS